MMKLTQISMVLAICRGILCANDSPTSRSELPPPGSSSFESACLRSNKEEDSRLSGKVLRISGCVSVSPSTGPNDLHRPTNVYVVAVHDDHTICTGPLEFQSTEPQAQFTLDVSLSDNGFNWPVFVDMCRGTDFESCHLIKVVSPEGVGHDDKHKSVSGENSNGRLRVTASRLLPTTSGNETAAAAAAAAAAGGGGASWYQVHIDMCKPTLPTQHDHNGIHKIVPQAPSLLYRRLSKGQPKTVVKRTKRQTNDNTAASAADMEYNTDEQMTGGPSAESVRRIPAQFANNRRGALIDDNRLGSYLAPAAAPATVVRRKWKSGASMQWIRKKSPDSTVSSDDDAVSEGIGIGDEDYPGAEQKRKWAKNGMGWIKRKWNKPGMGWLKRGEEEKRKWKSNAGMKWV